MIENPASCHFDPKVLECKAGDASDCLTPPQVESARIMYTAAINARTGASIFPASPGSELGWNVIGAPRPLGLATEAFKYVIAEDVSWEPA